MISLLIPVFNEERAIEDTILRAQRALTQTGEEFEIVVVDDGSTDDSGKIISGLLLPMLRVFRNQQNRGYGTAMKVGLRQAKGDVIATVDADGTYPIEDFPKLIAHLKATGADMVVGARTKAGAKIPLLRRPAKMILAFLANTLTGMRIPDNNSGMRVFRRSLGLEFMHLYPRGFSFTLTLTLASLTSGYLVEFVPIDYFKRVGKSSMGGWNGLSNFINFLGLVIRVTTYFRPVRFFGWPGGLLMLSGTAMIVTTVIRNANVSDSGLLLLLTGLQIVLFGMLAEIIVRHRQS
ncbi:TPA: glycosyltransferase family 2 protein [Candidatus Peribacteria bacterium]|nr:MAG: hypothetical protein A3J91_04805 [Candidatus Peribacteria bacterium RIFOXYC2_FULL_58_10]OGJ84469.1 MAG: hypothetical protein A2529_03720 [Candidatus Peribacteria bacterium RIFOXYD2_FULL_58_15]HAI98126.1 glycosyltransferase family 2 protein [Candidatus Peribacteria bacterium]HAS34593.1 glycosyltransferase family 2 protein [Candidatus Peribacteria bacterium]